MAASIRTPYLNMAGILGREVVKAAFMLIPLGCVDDGQAAHSSVD
jgi:hypothetical protein